MGAGFLDFIITRTWLVGLIVVVTVFILSYLWSDTIIAWLHKKSLGQRGEVLRILDLMFVEANQQRVTMIMILASFGVGFIVFLLLWPNVLVGLLFGAVVTVGGWSVPKLAINVLYEQRCRRFTDQMVDGMTIMANGIKAGLSITQAMERVSDNMKNPIKQEFNLILSQIRLGKSVEDSLVDLGERIPKPDVQMFVTAINILKETGGNLADTFETISETVRERQKVEKKIDALTAQGMTQGVILTLVPFALMVVLFLIDPEFIKPLFTTTLGWVLLLVMLVLQIIGGIVIRRIVKIEV